MQPRPRIPLAARFAFFWNRHGMRARSAIPRAIGRTIPLGDFCISTQSGARLSVQSKNLDVYAWIQNNDGRWDSHVMQACASLLRPGDIFYDIGSNTGLFAIDFGYRYPNINCYAFEAQPTQSEAIEKSIRLNRLKNVKCFNCLLGEQDGTRTLYLTSHTIHASIVPRESHFDKLEVPMRAIDSLSKAGVIEDPDIVKIDVEGSEFNVVKGSAMTFAKSVPTIIFEADDNMQRTGVDPDAFLGLIRSFGRYTLFKITASGAFEPVESLNRYGNYLALSERHEARMSASCVRHAATSGETR